MQPSISENRMKLIYRRKQVQPSQDKFLTNSFRGVGQRDFFPSKRKNFASKYIIERSFVSEYPPFIWGWFAKHPSKYCDVQSGNVTSISAPMIIEWIFINCIENRGLFACLVQCWRAGARSRHSYFEIRHVAPFCTGFRHSYVEIRHVEVQIASTSAKPKSSLELNVIIREV